MEWKTLLAYITGSVDQELLGLMVQQGWFRMVLPERPPGTDAMSEADLTTFVTRDAMIGVAKVAAPRVGGGA
jgi:hypothetical protein